MLWRFGIMIFIFVGIIACGDSSLIDTTSTSSNQASFKLDVPGSSSISAKSASGEVAEIVIVPSQSSAVNVDNSQSSNSQSVSAGCSLRH